MSWLTTIEGTVIARPRDPKPPESGSRTGLGEAAYLAGNSYRVLGRHKEAKEWLDRAEASYQKTSILGSLAAEAGYAQVALAYDEKRYEDVLARMPRVVEEFAEWGEEKQIAKCRLLEAATLKLQGRLEEALRILTAICNDETVKADKALHGRIVIEFGDVQTLRGKPTAAMAAYQKALQLLAQGGCSMALAALKGDIGTWLRTQRRFGLAIEAYRASRADFQALGMATFTAYYSLLIAETFLEMQHSREAEREITATLPLIEEHRLIPEGLAAAILLKESMRLGKTDPQALREVREHLQAAQK